MGVDVGAPSYEDDDYEDSSIATNNDDSTYYDSEEELDDDDDYEEVDIDMPELVDSPHYSSSYQKKMDRWNKNTLALHMVRVFGLVVDIFGLFQSRLTSFFYGIGLLE